MKTFTAILLLLVLFLQTSFQVVLFLNYKMQYTKYATELCVNKKIEAMQCNGKCALSKQLKAVEKQSTDQEPAKPEWKDWQMESLTSSGSEFIANVIEISFSAYDKPYSSRYSDGEFHPPA